ncbi:hypothetical protein WD019_02315 [Fictibacillus sp. Mic-4]|uniref:hypothetical protein n=1 Tax=Fictibacillus sp. Mic-4 TaxID=3132826 RepID=UPI003CE8A36D
MAALENVKVIDAKDGVITKIEVDGKQYERVDQSPREGYLIMAIEDFLDTTKGRFYEVINTDSFGFAYEDDLNDYHTITYYEKMFIVFALVSKNKSEVPKFKVGDLVRVIQKYHASNGEIIRITKINCCARYPYRGIRLKNGSLSDIFKKEHLEPYTPKVGDKLTIDGVEYTLESRKARVGEKIITILDEGKHGLYNVYTVKRLGCLGMPITKEKNCSLDHHEYMVLVPVKQNEDSENHEYKIGDLAVVTSNTSNHEFEIGEKVRIIHRSDVTGNYRVEHLDGSDHWYVSPSELEPAPQPISVTVTVNINDINIDQIAQQIAEGLRKGLAKERD